MTRATYNTDNTLTELPGMEPPNKLLYSEREILQYHSDVVQYGRHLATLRTLVCSPECRGLWKPGQVLAEGKDYEVRPVCVHAGSGEYADCLIHPSCERCAMTAFPLPVKSEAPFVWTDELVKEYAEQYRFSSSRISIEQFKHPLTKR